MGTPDDFERPVSPRPQFASGPASQLTPVRGERSLRPANWSGPPTTPPAGRFGRPEDRYEIPKPPVIEAPPSFAWRRLIAWLLATAVLAVTAGWVYVEFIRNPKPDGETVVPPAASASGPQIERADDLVHEYLSALAAGDTELARSLGTVGDGDPAAISPQAYQASLQQAPITDIRVPSMDGASTEVPASYRMGDVEVNTRFKVRRDDQGWRLTRSTVQVELQNPHATAMPVLLNGVPITGEKAEVLPGYYNVTTGLPLVDYPVRNVIDINSLEFDGIIQLRLTPELTQAGRDAMLAAGRASLSACMNSGSLTPAGCPNQLVSSGSYDPGSVRWELVNDPFAQANPALDTADQTLGQVPLVLRFAVSFTYSDGSTNGRQVLAPVSASYSGSLLVDDADAMQVEWSRAG